MPAVQKFNCFKHEYLLYQNHLILFFHYIAGYYAIIIYEEKSPYTKFKKAYSGWISAIWNQNRIISFYANYYQVIADWIQENDKFETCIRKKSIQFHIADATIHGTSNFKKEYFIKTVSRRAYFWFLKACLISRTQIQKSVWIFVRHSE